MPERPYPGRALPPPPGREGLAPRRRIAERTVAELDLDDLGLAVAVDLDVGHLAGLELGDRGREVVGVDDRLSADLGDHVAAARERRSLKDLTAQSAVQAGVCGRPARRH